MSEIKQSSRFSTLSIIGFGLIVSTPLAGIISFALLAAIIGESKLENENGMTMLGALSQLLPLILGACLIVIDLAFKPVIKRLWPVAVWAGISLLSVGIISGRSQDAVGANIGAGILILAGIFLLLVGIVLKLVKK